MEKCPYCPSTKFDIGTIKIGNSGSVDIVYCAECEEIIGILGNTLKKPHNTKKVSGETAGQLRA